MDWRFNILGYYQSFLRIRPGRQYGNGGQLMWSLATNYRPGVNTESKARQLGLELESLYYPVVLHVYLNPFPGYTSRTEAAGHFQDIYWYKITLSVKTI